MPQVTDSAAEILPPVTVPAARGNRGLRWIAGYNIVKGLLFLVAAIGFLGFLHKDVDAIVGHWMTALNFDLENRHIAALLDRLDLVTDRQIKQWSGTTFLLAGVFLTEGTGLLFKQRWAEYLTVIATASFIPLEVMECLKHGSFLMVGLLVVNVTIVGFLLANLRREVREEA